MVKQTRVVIPLDTPSAEGLAALAEFTGLGADALAKRILSGVLTAIAGAMETESDREIAEGSIFPGHRTPEAKNPEGIPMDIFRSEWLQTSNSIPPGHMAVRTVNGWELFRLEPEAGPGGGWVRPGAEENIPAQWPPTTGKPPYRSDD